MEAEGELEDEFEDEDEDEAEGFVNPVRRIYQDAETMAHLARQAALTESEGEAEAFIGALVPLAAKIIPRAARVIAAQRADVGPHCQTNHPQPSPRPDDPATGAGDAGGPSAHGAEPC